MPKTLHEQLKALYACGDGKTEVYVKGYRIDVVNDNLLIEVQTGSLHALRAKLGRLSRGRQRVLVVVPITGVRHLVRLDAQDEVMSRRRSPKRGDFLDVFVDLVGLAGLLPHPRITLELVLTEERETRRDDGRGSWRRRGVSRIDRELIAVLETRRLSNMNDYMGLLPRWPEQSPFTTGDLADCLGRSRFFAQRVAYFLRKGGALRPVGRSRCGIHYVKGL